LELVLRVLEALLVSVAGAIVVVYAARHFVSSSGRLNRHHSEVAYEQEREQARAEFLGALRDTASGIANDLEAKALSMRDLLREADETIATLAELLARSENVYRGAAASDVSTRNQERPSEGRQQEKRMERDVQRKQAPSRRPRAEQTKRSTTYREVHALAEEGKRPEEIAKQLGLGTGEVLLVLGLSRKA